MNFHRSKKHGESIWNLSVYNVYNRMNPNFVFLGYDTRKNESTGQYETVLVMDKYTILPIIPSISYTRKF